MIQFSNSVVIDSNPMNVFEYLDTLENFPKWNYAVKKILRTQLNEEKIGSKYRLYRDGTGSKRFEDVTITEHIQNKKISMDVKGGWFSYTMAYEISPSIKGTMLINKAWIKPSGMNSILLKLFQGKVENAVNQNLHVLKGILERMGDKNKINT